MKRYIENDKSGTVDLKITNRESTIEYVPKWKRVIAALLNIPVTPKYKYDIKVSVSGMIMYKHVVYRIEIEDRLHYFICNGTTIFGSRTRWSLSSLHPIDYLITEEYHDSCLIQEVCHVRK